MSGILCSGPRAPIPTMWKIGPAYVSVLQSPTAVAQRANSQNMQYAFLLVLILILIFFCVHTLHTLHGNNLLCL